MRKAICVVSMVIGVLAACFMAGDASALVIEILCTESEGCGDYTGTAPDGTIFLADPNPTDPSTGTGVFEPFKRDQQPSNGNGGYLQNGFNSDAGEPDINFDTKNGSDWTRSVLFSELGVIDIGGQLYYGLQLDANQNSKGNTESNQIVITDMQIYIGSDPDLSNPEATNTGVDGTGYTGTIFDPTDNSLLGLPPVWTLDQIGGTNGDVDVILQASICDSNGQCGSGHGDLDVFIPQSLLSGNPDDKFVLYTEYDNGNDGFEEWRVLTGVSVPEPGTLLLLGTGLFGMAVARRKVK
jgi:hypothetical protein